MEKYKIKTLFLDIGGVLLTNGWDRQARTRAALKFRLDNDEMDERHHLVFDTYEEGKLSLDGYLDRVVFHRDRPFDREAFKSFMFAQSQPMDDMLALVRGLKSRHALKVVAVSNEGRELTEYRIEAFHLDDIFDVFISSCFVHFRKPDTDIFRLALDVSHSRPDEVIYLDDRPLFVEVANRLGIHGMWHHDVETTRRALAERGLTG